MTTYVDVVVGGLTLKYCQLTDGSLVPANVALSLEGGTEVRLVSTQVADLKDITFPATYSLPSGQITDLKAVTVGNFPTSFNVGNFPSSFNVTNLPATYPLSSAQEIIITAIKTAVEAFSKGSGQFDSNTLRVAEARQTPAAITRSSVNAATSSTTLVSANAARSLLKIYNNSPSPLYLGFGATAVSATNFTVQLREDDYYDFPPSEAGLEVRGIWGAATGAARITEGT